MDKYSIIYVNQSGDRESVSSTIYSDISAARETAKNTTRNSGTTAYIMRIAETITDGEAVDPVTTGRKTGTITEV